MLSLAMWLLSILIAQLAGIIGSIFTVSSVNSWYLTINKPLWNPPGWLFGPVWTILYTLMGISAYLVWKKRKTNKKVNQALWVYGFHLILNTLWSIIFFGLQNPSLAFFEILILLGSIILTMILFKRINKLAFYLLIPYLLWVLFASYLNFAIWRLN